MIQIFDTRYLLRGTFKGKGFEIKNCDCEVTVNHLDTSSISANIYASSSDVPLAYLNLPIEDWGNVDFVDLEQTTHIRSRIKVQHHYSGIFGIIAELEKPDFTKYTSIHDNDFTADKLTINFTLTECRLFQLGYRGKVDVSKGYQRGMDSWSDDYQNEVIELEFPWGTAKFYRNIIIKGEENKLTVKTLAEPACVSLTFIPEQSEKINIIWDKIESIVSKFLTLLSYLDSQPIYWVKANGEVFKNDLRIMLIEQFQSTKKVNYRNDRNTDSNQIRKVRETYCELLQYFFTIEEETRQSIIIAINRYLLARNMENPIDVCIMLLQSANEVLIRHFNQSIKDIIINKWGYNVKSKINASMKTLALCELYEIDLPKSYNNLPVDMIKSGKEWIPFVQFRNNLTHEGGIPEGKTEKDANGEFAIMDRIFRLLVYNILLKNGHTMEGFKIINTNSTVGSV